MLSVDEFFDQFFSDASVGNPVNLLAWLKDAVNQTLGTVSDLSRDDASFPVGHFLDPLKLVEIAQMIVMLEHTLEDIKEYDPDHHSPT